MELKKDVKFMRLAFLAVVAYILAPMQLGASPNIMYFLMASFLLFGIYIAADRYYVVHLEANYLPKSVWEFKWLNSWMITTLGMLFAFVTIFIVAVVSSSWLVEKYVFILGKINGVENAITFNIATLVTVVMLFAVVIPMFLFPFWMISRHGGSGVSLTNEKTSYWMLRNAVSITFFLLANLSVFISMKLYQQCFI